MSQTVNYRSTDEIQEAISNFSEAQWARLHTAARFRTIYRPIEPNELLQEAFVRALTTRNCPADLDVVVFLIGIMRSIVSGEAEKAKAHPTIMMSVLVDDQGEQMDFPDHSPSIEQTLIDQEIRDGILALFDDDPIAKDILEGDLDGWNAADLRALTGLDKTAYDSKRKFIRRRLNKVFSEGLKP